MSSKTVRRQIWLLAILAGLALLWWQSSTSDRYADLSGYDVQQRPLPVPPGVGTPQLDSELSGPAERYYSSGSDSTGIEVRWQTRDGVTTVELTTIDLGLVTRRVKAELARRYYPNWVHIQDGQSGTSYDVRMSKDTMYVERDGASDTPRAYPYPSGALFEDLVLVQAMAWHALPDSATTQVIAFSDVGVPVRVFSVNLSRPDASTLLITASSTQTASLRFAEDSLRLDSYCTVTGTCSEARRDPIVRRGIRIEGIDPASILEAP